MAAPEKIICGPNWHNKTPVGWRVLRMRSHGCKDQGRWKTHEGSNEIVGCTLGILSLLCQLGIGWSAGRNEAKRV